MSEYRVAVLNCVLAWSQQQNVSLVRYLIFAWKWPTSEYFRLERGHWCGPPIRGQDCFSGRFDAPKTGGANHCGKGRYRMLTEVFQMLITALPFPSSKQLLGGRRLRARYALAEDVFPGAM